MMKRLLILFGVLLSATVALAQNRTYYYEQVARVKNGNRTATSGDGHYLTMNSRVLYESDASGLSKGRGTLSYEGTDEGLHRYGGNSYLGNGVTYYFASDYSRLNVQLYDGTVLVYERKGSANAARMRQYTPQGDGGHPGGTIAPNLPTDQRNNSNNSNNNRSNAYDEVACAYCHGTGRQTVTQSINVGGYGLQQSFVTCAECGLRYDSKSTSHRHQSCTHCHGRGKQRVR